MIYNFKSNFQINNSNNLIAIASNGSIYIQNYELHIENNDNHYIYKSYNKTVGWYIRNIDTQIDYYLGISATPIIDFENLDIKNIEILESILDDDSINKIKIAKLEQWFVEYDRICNEHARCQRIGIECHHNIEEWDVQAVENAERLKSLRNSEN